MLIATAVPTGWAVVIILGAGLAGYLLKGLGQFIKTHPIR